MSKYFNTTRIKGAELLSDALNYVKEQYSQYKESFTYASPYGQIILVLHNITQLLFYYIKDALKQSNFATANRTTTIYGLAELQGHTATRGISAIGQISITKNPDSTVHPDAIHVPNYSRLLCVDTGNPYVIVLPTSHTHVTISNLTTAKFNIVQGEMETQAFTGTGTDVQSFVVAGGINRMIENDRIWITVNGVEYERVDSLYDSTYKQPVFLVKNDISGRGITVVFGTSSMHAIPPLGSEILIHYLITKGAGGNLTGITAPKFTWTDSAYDSTGTEINMNEYVVTTVSMTPEFGANSESPTLTKVLAPNISRNFIMYDERSIEYFFKKMNFFKTVKVIRDSVIDSSNIYSVLLLPDLKTRLSTTENYFTAPISKFILSTPDRDRLLQSILDKNIKSTNISLNLYTPKFWYYAMVVDMTLHPTYSNKIVSQDAHRTTITNVINEYLLSTTRTNVIPHSDIVRILDELEFCDTVKVTFIPEHSSMIDQYGNIRVEDTAVAVCRGGFVTEQGVEVSDSLTPTAGTIGALTINISII